MDRNKDLYIKLKPILPKSVLLAGSTGARNAGVKHSTGDKIACKNGTFSAPVEKYSN